MADTDFPPPPAPPEPPKKAGFDWRHVVTAALGAAGGAVATHPGVLGFVGKFLAGLFGAH